MPKPILIGADPEVFLKDTKTGHFVSAHGQFPGTKDNPVPLGNRGFMQVDGHALEFNIHPCATENEFVENIQDCLALLKREVRLVDPDLEIVFDPVAEFDETYFESLSMDSKILGCNPDFSAVTGDVLDAPDISNVPIRTSSGHIHIGWTQFEDAWDDNQFALRLEIANKITPHLLSVSKEWETDASNERRRYYGGNGAFRPKDYGVELRCLDGLWLTSEDRMRKVYRAAYDNFCSEFKELAA